MTRKLAVTLVAVLATLIAGCGSTSTSTSTHALTSSPSRTHARAPNLPGTSGIAGHAADLATLPHRQRKRFAAHLTGFSGVTVPEKLTAYAQDLAKYWAWEFNHAPTPLLLAPATLNIIDQTPATCGATSVTSTGSPTYCQTDSTIDLPLQTTTAAVQPLGDAAMLLLVSNLYGYHVENALGMFGRSFTAAQLETTSACLSGIYFDYVAAVGRTSVADEQAVDHLLALLGAPSAAPGSVSSADLISAFNRGATAGNNFRACTPAA